MLSTKARVIVGSLAVLIVLALAAALFVRYEIRKSFPVTSGSAELEGLVQPVVVARDEYGIPDISAASEHDLLAAMGYVHAQDRLWQMDMQRRAAAGRLSELFGPTTVPFDRMFRIVGLAKIARNIEDHLPPESRERLAWYTEGVNAFLATHRGSYPVEFDLLRYDPEPWSPLDCILVGRMMAWELNLSWWTDLTIGAIAERVGLEKAMDIFPSYPREVQPIVAAGKRPPLASLGLDMVRTAEAYRAFAGIPAVATGSNAWVVGPSKSATGAVILANDTHLHLSIPSPWYEVQMRCPAYNVRGMSVPGAPGVVAGRNDSIAWGITNAMADDADFYVERIDSTDGTQYWYDGRWVPLSIRTEEIGVRGDSAVPVVIRETQHGPVVTDIRTSLQRSQPPYVASMRWTGREVDDQIGTFGRINRARNWNEFTEALRHFAVPGQNFVYGDVRGNIGYWCGVLLPIRGRQNSLLPMPGWDASTEWRGFVPFEQLPHRYNPPEGFIATANNKIAGDDYPYHISDLWEPPSRIMRLREVLGKKGEMFTMGDFERLQNDTYSHLAREVVPFIFAAFADSASVRSGDERLLEYFRNWNFYFTREDIATSIFQMFFVRLLENTFKDEIGDDLYHDFVLLVNVPVRVMTRLLREGSSPWFDDVGTTAVETRDEIVRRSLRQAGDALRERFGPEMKTWRWGDMHTVTFKHPFGLQKPLDRIFNVGPFPASGGSSSLVSCEYSFNTPFAVTVGPSFRQIFDMANPREVRAVLASGQSGQIFHRHYDDQTHLWLNGGYRVARRDDAGRDREVLRLEPGR
jgi:penicillin amidase